ncbi:MAG TPA: anaerobic carbon-monoxide dehydrogenase catalytic subunit [Victivallales bacterium]|nr:anaerobic carbon-monoxide dehydrogenase catalytic subunit [Victivallales bacterium]
MTEKENIKSINAENHDHEHHHHHGGTNDYMKAVSEYRKTFASKQDVINNTPDPGVRDMLLRMEQIGCENSFDRFDKQKPQCSFGIAGTCCKICFMGPCKITPKSPKGVCGADADLIVARNVLRSLAAGVAAHGVHGREVVMALRKAAEGELNLPIVGDSVLNLCVEKFGINPEGKSKKELVLEVTDILLDDMSRTKDGTFKLIKAFASPERQKVWEKMDIIPISAYHEVFEALHKTNCGTDGDWENTMKQFGRCGLSFLYSGVLTPYLATDILFGHPVKHTAKVNVGAIKEGYVNIAVHGHLPTLVSEVIKQGRSEEFIKLAKQHGAKGIQFYGICCTGLAALYRYKDVIPLSNAVGAELILGTGALDLWLADIQDVFPGIMEVAKCFRTTVITTSDSARLPEAEHYGYDRHHSNFNETESLAKKIVTRAVESFAKRRDIPVFIPPYEVDAEVGFSPEYVDENLGMNKIAEAMKEGKILGVLNMVGCCNPRVVFEKAIVDIAEKLIKNNVIILTNGCASFPLLKLGFCKEDAGKKAGNGLKSILPEGFPPVWHMGECIDNARCANTFAGIAGAAGYEVKDMPFAMSSPEWSNEKAIGASFSFRLLGINSYHCVYPAAHGSEKVMNHIMNAKDTLGSTMTVDLNPSKLADKIIEDFKEKRKALEWN